MNEHYPFVLPPLPYADNALEPYINQKTIKDHHDVFFNGYVTRLNNALKDYPQYHRWSLERLILENECLPKNIRTIVFNNAGGLLNHTIYFDSMTPQGSSISDTLKRKITYCFGSFEEFLGQMLEAGLSVFGSGWAWLVKDCYGNLHIITTKNQDTPLSQKYTPILPVDVWEHAYIPQYIADRKAYIENWAKIINWTYVEKQTKKPCIK